MNHDTVKTYTSLERVLTSLSFREPDRVPFFLLLTTHGARELGMPIKDYFLSPEAVAEGQFRMRERYGHDCLYAFTYAAVETEAWGGSVIFTDDGPPNSGEPAIGSPSAIDDLVPPDIPGSPSLVRILESIRLMKKRAAGSIPIIAVVISPFSLPVMQMGFPAYLDLIHDDRKRFQRLMEANEDFCARWANAQLEAGATAICYFDPVSSTDMVPKSLYLETGFRSALRTIPRIKGPTATHFASGRSLDLLGSLPETGTAIAGISGLDDLASAKRLTYGKLSLLGNLNGIAMRVWSKSDTEREVKRAFWEGAKGGGFILSDNHGEIPWAVPETVLDDVAEAVKTWGRYPMQWVL